MASQGAGWSCQRPGKKAFRLTSWKAPFSPAVADGADVLPANNNDALNKEEDPNHDDMETTKMPLVRCQCDGDGADVIITESDPQEAMSKEKAPLAMISYTITRGQEMRRTRGPTSKDAENSKAGLDARAMAEQAPEKSEAEQER